MSLSSSRVTLAVALSVSVSTFSGAACAAGNELSEVIVTSTAFHGAPDDILHPVVVLSGDALQQQIGSSLGETLAHQPGISASYYGPAASRPIIRGLAGDRVLVLEDGVSSLDLSALSEDHAVSTEDAVARQIEIIKGPATLLYGSGAVGGAINVVTRRIPATLPGQAASGSVSLRGDSASRLRAAVGLLDLASDDVTLHADGYTRRSDDVTVPGGRIANSDSRGTGGSVGASLLNEAGYAGVSIGALNENYGIPQAAGSAAGGPRIDMKQTRLALRAEQGLGDGALERVAIAATHSNYDHSELESDGTVGTQFTQRGTELRLALDHLLGDFKGTVGAQYRLIDFSAGGTAPTFVPQSITQTTGLFAFEQYALGRLSFEAGLRGESQTITPAASSALAKHQTTSVSGSLGALWRINQPLSLAVNLTHSERPPSAPELYAKGAHDATQQYIVGDATLGKESAMAYDLTLRGNGTLHWELSAYLNQFHDYIYLAPTVASNGGLPVFDYRQADARFTGFEAQVTVPLVGDGAARLDLNLAADYVRGQLTNGANLPQLPPLHAGGELQGSYGDWTATLSAWRYLAQNDIATFETPTDGYTLLGATVSHRWTLGRGSLLSFLNGSNLGDQLARRSTSPLKAIAPLPGRSVTLGLRLAL
jgi:iron complex outermembrane receptor protein